MKKHLLLVLNLLFLVFVCGFEKHSPSDDKRPHYESPDLVVGIMVDQFRYDFIYRYWDNYGDDGFKRILKNGFSFDNTQFDYAPTFTGPGHASVYTGTTPAMHGIVENRWFERELNLTTYVTDDPHAETLGSTTDQGKMSPRYLMTTTIGDELRLHTNMRSRVLGVSLKDRGSILPAGHTGDAYWFDYETGEIITSTYYHDELPEWVQRFNDRKLVEEYLGKPWEPFLPADVYLESRDANPVAAAFPGQTSPDMPHNLPEIVQHTGPGVVAETPFGDKLVFELARAAIENEMLGKGDFTDLLAISFSSPDHIGHRFGPSSMEVQDTYLRLDYELGKFIRYLDERFGMENVLVFMTSDHGAAHEPTYLKEKNIPAGYIDESESDALLRAHLKEIFGIDPVAAYRRFQVYLDRDLVRRAGLPLKEVREATARFLPELEGIAGALTANELLSNEYNEGVRALVQKGFYPPRSGDVLYWLDPQWMRTRRSGTTHGSPYSYDTRAPLLWYGWDIPPGRSLHPVFISDIASTLAIILNTPYPSGNTGNPINDYMWK